MSGGPATPAPYEGGRHVPNILTVSRLLLAAAFFVVLSPWQYEKSPAAAGTGIDWWILFAAALFGLAAITDALDGMLARRWGVVSVFGRIMDPFADKILILGAFILLAGRGFMMSIDQKAPIPMSAVTPWMVIVILARELLVTSMRAVVESEGKSFAASASGKWKMILQSICVPVVLVLLAFPQSAHRGIARDWSYWTIHITVWATVAVTVWSGLPYLARAFTAMREARRAQDPAA
jgi:CDP-diacylglycerol--glycerol-3-phosphate 3-phosphatidyltransferase